MEQIAQVLSSNANNAFGNSVTIALVIILFFAFLMFTYGLPIEAAFVIAIPLLFILAGSQQIGLLPMVAIGLAGGLFLYLAATKFLHK